MVESDKNGRCTIKTRSEFDLEASNAGGQAAGTAFKFLFSSGETFGAKPWTQIRPPVPLLYHLTRRKCRLDERINYNMERDLLVLPISTL